MHFEIHSDGGCSPNPGPGGYAAILVSRDDDGSVLEKYEVGGCLEETTNNAMEIWAAIAGLYALPRDDCRVMTFSDSTYVVNTMTLGWKRRFNKELWAQLDELVAKHDVDWQHVPGHSGDEYNERAHKLVGHYRGMCT